MSEFWVDLREWNSGLATEAIESGANALVAEDPGKVRELGRICAIAPGGDLELGRDVFEVEIGGKEDEEEVIRLSRQGWVVVTCTDWTVIPLENLVAQSDRIIASVGTREEAEVVFGVLEKGVGGILLRTHDPSVIRSVGALISSGGGEVSLTPYTITSVTQGTMGDRVCIDTCSLLGEGEGMLIGNTSSSLLLVHPETLENPYVSPRPFRVNAGAVHAYVMMADGKTCYLSELGAGDHVRVVRQDGSAYEAMVGRVKVERRPLLLVEAESEENKASLVLQNAETVRLVGEDGSPVSVTVLAPGDRVLGLGMKGGRHFGMSVDEMILEK